MSILSTPLDRARKSLAEGISSRTVANATLEAHDLAPADPGDSAAIKQHRARRTRLAEDVEIADGVVAHWQAVVTKLEAEAAEKAAEAERAAVEKEADKLKALVHEIVAENVKQKARIAKLADHIERARAAGVEDAEIRVRRQPSTTQKAITETLRVWFDADGKRYATEYGHDDEGRWVKMPGRVQREVVDTIRSEMTLPGEMPERFASAIRLVDLEGRPL